MPCWKAVTHECIRVGVRVRATTRVKVKVRVRVGRWPRTSLLGLGLGWG